MINKIVTVKYRLKYVSGEYALKNILISKSLKTVPPGAVLHLSPYWDNLFCKNLMNEAQY